MPYRRRRKRGPVAKRAKIYGRAGYQLYKDISYLKTLVNSEAHYFTAATSNNIDSVGTIQSLNQVAVGDGTNRS